jgi:hypothetical protein
MPDPQLPPVAAAGGGDTGCAVTGCPTSFGTHPRPDSHVVFEGQLLTSGMHSLPCGFVPDGHCASATCAGWSGGATGPGNGVHPAARAPTSKAADFRMARKVHKGRGSGQAGATWRWRLTDWLGTATEIAAPPSATWVARPSKSAIAAKEPLGRGSCFAWSLAHGQAEACRRSKACLAVPPARRQVDQIIRSRSLTHGQAEACRRPEVCLAVPPARRQVDQIIRSRSLRTIAGC